jgi:PAS domain-containing protein
MVAKYKQAIHQGGMKLEYWAIPLSLLFCLLVWVTSALLNHFVFHKGPLWELLTFNMPAHGAFMGSAGVAIVLLFSILSAITLTRLKRANERNEHQNRILRGIRNVSQLIMKEDNREKLIRGACDLLVENQDFEIAWILLADPPGGFACSAGPGHDEELSALIRLVRQDEHPLCVRHLIEGSGAFFACEGTSEYCDCPLANAYGVSTSFLSRLEFGDTAYGFMGVSVPKTMAHNSEELDLFLGVAEDIVHALHNLDVDEERTRAAEMYRSVVDTPGVWFVRVNREGRSVFVNRNAQQILNRTKRPGPPSSRCSGAANPYVNT